MATKAKATKAKLPRVSIVDFGDWKAIYLDRKKIFENESLRPHNLIQLLQAHGVSLGFTFEQLEGTEAQCEETQNSGEAPETID